MLIYIAVFILKVFFQNMSKTFVYVILRLFGCEEYFSFEKHSTTENRQEKK